MVSLEYLSAKFWTPPSSQPTKSKSSSTCDIMATRFATPSRTSCGGIAFTSSSVCTHSLNFSACYGFSKQYSGIEHNR